MGCYRRPAPGRWHPDGRPEHLKGACEGSLRRLGLDRIDLYQLHTVDPHVPFEDSVGALADLQREGKIAARRSRKSSGLGGSCDRRAEIHEAFLALGCCLVCFRRLRL
jgi:aryl-alcohol dehydrogenase-like predicted oxidoreductase